MGRITYAKKFLEKEVLFLSYYLPVFVCFQQHGQLGVNSILKHSFDYLVFIPYQIVALGQDVGSHLCTLAQISSFYYLTNVSD